MPVQIKQMWNPGSLRGPHAVAEAIAAKDLNNLYRTSCYFRDRARYDAFCAQYAVMRVVDDRIDGLVERGTLAESDGRRELDVVDAWRRTVAACLTGHEPAPEDVVRCDHPHIGALHAAFTGAVSQFPVPSHLWEDFFAAMRQDLDRSPFATYGQFLEYAAGAAVAPTTIYLHLICADRREDESVFDAPPGFDILGCGQALGRFAYLAHVLRDLRQDVMTGLDGLLYLSAEDMAAHGVTVASLRHDAAAGAASPRLRGLVRDMTERASAFAQEGRQYLTVLDGRLRADRAFVLELIVRIYERVLSNIVSCSHDVMADGHRLTSREKDRIAREIAAAQGVIIAG